VLRVLGTRPFFGRGLFVSDAAKVFDAEGRLTDARVRDQAQKFIAGFAAFVKA